MSHIFISYSRKDLEFAQKIVTALSDNKLDTWIDWKSIPKGEDWEQEIYHGIEEADAFLFLISPDSVASEMCNKEIDHAIKNGKRILPIVLRDTDRKIIHTEINKRNWIFCREGEDDFSKATEETRKTIHTDYEWLKRHTELQVKALKWEQHKDNSRLLRGKELREAEQQLADVDDQGNPQPTKIQREYILASQRNEVLTRRQTMTSLGFGLAIVALLAVLAWAQRNTAVAESHSRATAESNAIAEANARATAQANAETEASQRATAQAIAVANAQEAQKQANIALARLLATQAQNLSLDIGTTAIQSGLLAVQAEKLDASLMADQALRRYIAHTELPIAHMTHHGIVRSVSFSPDGKLVVSGSTDGVASVWDAMTGKEISRMTHDGSVNSVDFSPDGKFVVSGSEDSTVRVWEVSTGKEIAQFGHIFAVSLAAFSPDGKYVVSGSWDGAACVREAASGHTISCLVIPANQLNFNVLKTVDQITVTSAAFSPDGKYVVSGSWDGIAHVWEVTTGHEVSHMAHDTGINFVAFSPDGKYVLSESFDWDTRIWEVISGKLVAEVNVPSSVKPIVFDPDPNSDFAVSGYRGQSILMWNITTEFGKSLSQEGSTISVAFSQDGKYILSGNLAGIAQIWESDTGEQTTRIIHENGAYSVALSPDGKWIVSGGCDVVNISGGCIQGSAYVWANKSSNNIIDIDINKRIRSFKFSPDGKLFVGLIYDNEYTSALNLNAGMKLSGIWDTETGVMIASLPYTAEVTSISFSPDSQYIVSGSTDKTARIWEVMTGNELNQTIFSDSVDAVVFSSDGKYVVSDSGGKVYLWDISGDDQISFAPQENPSEIAGINLDGTLNNSIALSGDSKLLASVQGDTTYIWNVSTKKEIARITQDSPVDFLSFTSDGRWVVTTVCDQTAPVLGELITRCAHATVSVWDPTSGKEVAHGTHNGSITSIAFSPNGKYIVSGSDDRTARLWDLSTGAEILRMTHNGSVDSVAFSLDGNYIVSAGCDEPGSFLDLDCLQGGAHVWEVLTGDEIAHVNHNDRVIAVTFSSDGRYVISSSADGNIKTWFWLANDLVGDACRRLPRNLTRAEWNQYIGDALPYQAVCPNLPIEPEVIITPTP